MKRRICLSILACLWIAAWAVSVGAQEPSLVLNDGGIQFSDDSIQTSAPSLAPVEDTGQDRCWAIANLEIDCAGTAMDGDLRAGVAWPTPRFTDNKDGTVTDKLTSLIWLKDANCFGPKRWTAALSSANNLMSGSCGLSDGSLATDWRLPNIKEIWSLVDFAEADPALPTGHPFTNLQESYWSSSTFKNSPGSAWSLFLVSGSYGTGGKDRLSSLWPVRDHQNKAAPELSLVLHDGGIQFPDGTIQTSAPTGVAPVERTGQNQCWDVEGSQIPCPGTGQDGDLQTGVEWPTPRFTGNGDGTVTDNLTGLVWLKDVGCLGFRTWINAVEIANGMRDGICNLTDGSVATDWRLPNVRELSSVLDYGELSPALPSGHPFLNVEPNSYWTSTADAALPTSVWDFFIPTASVSRPDKSVGIGRVWPVRGGR